MTLQNRAFQRGAYLCRYAIGLFGRMRFVEIDKRKKIKNNKIYFIALCAYACARYGVLGL